MSHAGGKYFCLCGIVKIAKKRVNSSLGSMRFFSRLLVQFFRQWSHPGFTMPDHCEKNWRPFSQWSVDIKSKIKGRYDMDNDHCEKKCATPPPFSRWSGAKISHSLNHAVLASVVYKLFIKQQNFGKMDNLHYS